MSVVGSGFTAAAAAPVAANCTPAGFDVPTTALLPDATDAATVSPDALVVAAALVVALVLMAGSLVVTAGGWDVPPLVGDWPPAPVDGACPLTAPVD